MKTNFDDILKRKLEQQHFPVDQNHRAEMIDLLDSQNTRKPFPFWWLGGLVLFVAIAGLYLATYKENTDQKGDKQYNREMPISTPAAHEVIAGVETKQHMALDETGENSVQQNSENVEAQTAAILEGKQHLQELGNSLEGNSQVVNTKSNSNRNSNSKGTSNELPVETEPGQVSNLIVSEHKLSLLSEEELNEISVDKSPGENIDFDDAAIVKEEISETSLAARLNVSVAAIAPVELAGIAAVSDVMPTQVKPASFKKSLFLFGETGLGLVLGAQPDFEAGWKLRVGVGIGYRLAPKVQITLTGGYLYQNGGFDFQRLSSVNQPGFGTRSSFNSLTPDKLHFVYSKLGVQARSHRHIFSAHAGMQMLYGAQGDITTIVEDQFASGTVETNQYSWLKTDGLRKVHWTADLSYGYQITPRFSISAGADYYFSSFTVEDASLELEGYTWSGAYSPFQPFININYMLYGRL